jgi:hypothetical protein
MLQSGAICVLAQQIAKVPGFTSQAQTLLDSILAELCQNYDFDLAKGLMSFNFNPSLGNGILGGPIPLASDYLRAKFRDVFYSISGYPYFMKAVDLAQIDQTPQAPGLQSFPSFYATDMSQSPPVAYVYPPPSGAYPVTWRYYRQMPSLFNALGVFNSAAIPWFPNDVYLYTRLAGELMKLAGDDRWVVFLGRNRNGTGAQDILDRYLDIKDDHSDRAETVQLDTRTFGIGSKVLPTKAQPL